MPSKRSLLRTAVAFIKVKFCNIKKKIHQNNLMFPKFLYHIVLKWRTGSNCNAMSKMQRKPPYKLWQEMQSTIIKIAQKYIPYKETRGLNVYSEGTVRIAEQRREAKAARDRNKARRLNVEFQRTAKKDKESYWKQSCIKLEDCRRGHTSGIYSHRSGKY